MKWYHHIMIAMASNAAGISFHCSPVIKQCIFWTPDDVINGNIFRVTGPLCGELTGPRWPVTGIHRWPKDSRHKGPVTMKDVSNWWLHHNVPSLIYRTNYLESKIGPNRKVYHYCSYFQQLQYSLWLLNSSVFIAWVLIYMLRLLGCLIAMRYIWSYRSSHTAIVNIFCINSLAPGRFDWNF